MAPFFAASQSFTNGIQVFPALTVLTFLAPRLLAHWTTLFPARSAFWIMLAPKAMESCTSSAGSSEPTQLTT
jgi:hypothetical protein